MRHVIVIGAGASGMMAAIVAARKGCKVTILEHTSRSGRKIEITGNGKCNFTNGIQSMKFYHSSNPEYAEGILGQFSYEDTIAFFRELGIVPKEKNGYYYPYSGQAQAVAYALRMEAERLKVKFACNINIQEICKNQSFEIITEGYTYYADAVILAAGSAAAPSTGSDGSGYELARRLGHQVKKPLPALVQLLSKERELDTLAGLRCEGEVTLLIEEAVLQKEQGEIQFIKNGLSGIPVFQLSGMVARALDEGKKVKLKVNLLAGTGWEEPVAELEKRRETMLEMDCNLQQFLNGLLHERASKAVLSKLAVKGSRKIKDLERKQWQSLYALLTEMEFVITAANTFAQAQVCSGGVLLDQLQKNTLESKKLSGLYFAGEILDVDGACGGYNLQWAWASGYVAGNQAAVQTVSSS